MSFKVGDKCYSRFTLSTIYSMDDGRVTGVETEYFKTGGYDLTCFPVTEKVIRVSDICKSKSDIFHGLCFNGLNHPDLSRELERRWVQLCRTDEGEQLEILLDDLNLFCDHVVNTVEYIRTQNVDGIYIVR